MMLDAIAVQIMNFNESPVFLLLDDNIGMKHKSLPVNLYESGGLLHTLLYNNLIVCNLYPLQTFLTRRICLAELHILDCHPQSVFVEAKYKIEVCAQVKLSMPVLPGVPFLCGTSTSSGISHATSSDAVPR